jgi:Ca2+-binding EF-hand superfamily protein
MVGFSLEEIEKLFIMFDFDRTGYVSYDEFLREIRGPMNANRK